MRERGYLKFIILLICLPLLGLLFLKPKVTPSGSSTGYCLNTASTQTVINYDIQRDTQNNQSDTDIRLRKRINELPYSKIKGDYKKLMSQPIDVPKAVFKYHYAKAGKITDQNNISKLVYVHLTHCDGNVGGDPTEGGTLLDVEYDSKCTPDERKVRSSVSYVTKANIFDIDALPDNRVFNLIMLDVTGDPKKNPNPQPEVVKLEYYIKDQPIHNELEPGKYLDGPIPQFIKEYCRILDQNLIQGISSNDLLLDPGATSIPLELEISKNNPKLTFYTGWTRTDSKGKVVDLTLPNETGTYKLVGFSPVNSPLGQANSLNFLKPYMSESDLRAQLQLPDQNLMTLGGIYTDTDQEYYFGEISAARFYILIKRDDPRYVYYYTKKLADSAAQPAPPNPKLNKLSLQLDTFTPLKIPSFGWMVPECKPAIYLYPQTPTQVQVKVAPKGFLTYTDPVYPADGWNVLANPNGNITTAGQNYDYLYYESKIEDSAIDKPTKGYVVKSAGLPDLFSGLLPKLGLNSKETADFKNYWEKLLTAPYYFVGVMENSSIDKIEPLTITPSPNSIIRARLYFQALDQPITVDSPTINTPTRFGFTLVEWGGLVKTDPAHPFTCSQ